jgi:superfamily II DNA helicase RecQ
MVKLIHDHSERSSVPIKCICYCLGPKTCRSISGLFDKQRIESVYYHSVDVQNRKAVLEMKTALDMFRNDDTVQVICATSALGRGVHFEFPIQFVFHCNLPLSLTGMHPVQLRSSHFSYI